MAGRAADHHHVLAEVLPGRTLLLGGVHVHFDSNHVTSTSMRSLTPVLAQRFDEANG